MSGSDDTPLPSPDGQEEPTTAPTEMAPEAVPEPLTLRRDILHVSLYFGLAFFLLVLGLAGITHRLGLTMAQVEPIMAPATSPLPTATPTMAIPPTATPTHKPRPTQGHTPTPRLTPTTAPTAGITPTPTRTPRPKPTVTPSPSPTIPPSPTTTASPSPTNSPPSPADSPSSIPSR